MKEKMFISKVAIMFFMSIFILNCAVSKGTINSYIEPTYESGAIKRLAVFSIRNARFAPSEARTINKKIIQALSSKNPQLEIVSPSEALRKINDNELAKEWANFVEDYYTSGIANRSILLKISKILNVDAIMQGQLLGVQQSDGAYFSGRKAKSRITISFSIIESKTAKPIWEATADGIKGAATTLSSAPPIIKAINLAIDKITQNIPRL